MAADVKVTVGCRVSAEVRERLEAVAKKEKRSPSMVMSEMLTEGLRRYEKGGWNAIYEGN